MKSDRVRRVLTLFLCLLVFAVVAVEAWHSAGAEAWARQILPQVGVPTTVPATATTTTLPPVPTTVPATATTYTPPVPTTVSATATTFTPGVPTTVSAGAFTTATEPTATTIETDADEGGLAGGYIALIVVAAAVVLGVGTWVYARRRGSPKG